MRILHTVASVAQRSGGLGRIAMGFAQGQNGHGQTTAVWHLNLAPGSATVVDELGYCPESVRAFPILGPRQLGFSPGLERHLIGESGSGFDVVHQHGIWQALSRGTQRWHARFDRPTIVAPHGSLHEHALRRSRLKKRIARWLYEDSNLAAASCLHATAPAEAEAFRRYGLVNPIAIIPPGIPDQWTDTVGDAERFRAAFDLPADRRIRLFLSRIHPLKGLPLLFEALGQMRREMSDTILAIAGYEQVGHGDELRQLAAHLGIVDNIRFVGPLFGASKRDALAASDFFVLPTYTEGYSLAIAEALGAGVPVLTTYGAPWEELVTHRCGWWVPIESGAIREALTEALRVSSSERAAMGQRGRDLVRERHTWSRQAARSIALYEWLAGRGDRPDFVVVGD